MDVPILRQGNTAITVLHAEMTDSDLIDLQSRLTDYVGDERIEGVIMDISALDTMDSFGTGLLRNTCYMTRCRGAETVVVGMRPEVAFSMVQLGLQLADIPTALDLDEGISMLKERLALKHSTDTTALEFL